MNKFEQFLEEVYKKTTINDVISFYINTQKRGQNYVAVCPFHEDNDPSLTISNEKRIFKCFSCNAKGNMITFIKKKNGISTMESVKELSKISGIDWKDFFNNHTTIEIDQEVKDIWKINKEALNYFEYVEKNNIKDSPPSLLSFLLKKNYPEEKIIKAGLARIEEGKIKPFFYNRKMFPIKDINGNIVGFSGRKKSGGEKYVKYLNTPTTKAFKKNEHLFNLDKAKSNITLKDQVIIVEGFKDVYALEKLGFENVVATMGTELSNKQFSLLKGLTNNFILGMDTDGAGINSTYNISKLLFKNNKNIRVLDWSKEAVNDADEFINKKELIHKAKKIEEIKKDLLIFILEKLNVKNNFLNLEKIVNLISYVNNGILKLYYINIISNISNINQLLLAREIDNLTKERNKTGEEHF